MIFAIIAFIVGAVIGMAFVLFMIGAKSKEKENEIYMEGFNAGYQSMWNDDGK